jgi:hypothetical protein
MVELCGNYKVLNIKFIINFRVIPNRRSLTRNRYLGHPRYGNVTIHRPTVKLTPSGHPNTQYLMTRTKERNIKTTIESSRRTSLFPG